MLEKIDKLKEFEISELKSLAVEIRERIIEDVAKNGGHIASSLGAVEIAIALHFVFNSPKDAFIWDVGHQAYAHKLLTKRSLDKLRKKDGISGFIKPSESEHDLFTSGHAGVAISEALGYAITHKQNKSIAIVGDGAMTAGVSYEALNHAGAISPDNLIVIYNDNEMSISPNVGALSSFITKNISSNSSFLKLKKEVTNILSAVPFQKLLNIDLVDVIRRLKLSATSLVSPISFFEAFGFEYLGPIDGHDLGALVAVLNNLKKVSYKPIFLHVKTKKGMGFNMAEESPSKFHGVPSFSIKNGLKSSSTLKYNTLFGKTLLSMAEKNKNIVAITPAMKEGSSLVDFAEKFPDRFFDVAIAEQHAVAFASGLAKNSNFIPVVSIYSTFLQRAIDQVIHDIALNNEHVVFAVDRAGFVGDDGATHHGLYDIPILRAIPQLTILAPASGKELEETLDFAINNFSKPIFVRYPRGKVFEYDTPTFKFGIWQKVMKTGANKKTHDLAILSTGSILENVLNACNNIEDLDIVVYNASTIKPLDQKTILKLVNNSKTLLSVEEGALNGGFGSSVLEFLSDNNIQIPFKRLGIADKFIEQATQDEQRNIAGLSSDKIKKAIYDIVHKQEETSCQTL